MRGFSSLLPFVNSPQPEHIISQKAKEIGECVQGGVMTCSMNFFFSSLSVHVGEGRRIRGFVRFGVIILLCECFCNSMVCPPRRPLILFLASTNSTMKGTLLRNERGQASSKLEIIPVLFESSTPFFQNLATFFLKCVWPPPIAHPSTTN